MSKVKEMRVTKDDGRSYTVKTYEPNCFEQAVFGHTSHEDIFTSSGTYAGSASSKSEALDKIDRGEVDY